MSEALRRGRKARHSSLHEEPAAPPIDAEFRGGMPEADAANGQEQRDHLHFHGGCTTCLGVADQATMREWMRKFRVARGEMGRLGARCVRGEVYQERQGEQGGDPPNSQVIGAAEQVAHAFGVTERTIRNDGQLAMAVAEIAAVCGPEARRLLLCSEHHVTRAEVVRLAKKEQEEQQETLRYLREHKKLPPQESGSKKAVLPRKIEEMVPVLLRRLTVAEAEAFGQSFAAELEEARERAEADRQG